MSITVTKTEERKSYSASKYVDTDIYHFLRTV